MKRVLMVSCEGLGNGGVQAIMMGIVRTLSCDCHFDMLLFTSQVRFYDEEFLSFGGRIFRIPHYEGSSRVFRKLDSVFRDYYVYRKVKKLLSEQEHYDVIHCNKQFESALLLKAAAEFNIPVRICHTHIVSLKEGIPLDWLNKARRKIIEKYASQCVGCSKEACESFFSKNISYRVIPNFYNDKIFIYNNLKENCGVVVLTQVGALNENKNQLFSIKVAKCLNDMGEKVKLNIIGFDNQEGYKELLNKKIEDFNLRDAVTFYPGDTFIPNILCYTNFFLMPSKHEGFGIVLLEAQAVGVRCLASSSVPKSTNCGGVTYLSIDDIDSSRKWAEEICNIKRREGQNHNMYDTSEYKLSEVMRQYKKMYNLE